MIPLGWIMELFRKHGIRVQMILDEEYNVAGNTDNSPCGVCHNCFSCLVERYDRTIHDWLINYRSDVFDCDDYAMLFKSVAASCGLNAVAFAVGRLYDSDGNLAGYHAFNIIVWSLSPCPEGPEDLVLLLVEPQIFPYGGIRILDGNRATIHYTYVVDYVLV